MVDYELKVAFYNPDNTPYAINGHNTNDFSFDLSNLEELVIEGHGNLIKGDEKNFTLGLSGKEFYDETYLAIHNNKTEMTIYSPQNSLAYLSSTTQFVLPPSFTIRFGNGLKKVEYTLIKKTGGKIKMSLELIEKQTQTTVK
jgi:hypothetical protein